MLFAFAPLPPFACHLFLSETVGRLVTNTPSTPKPLRSGGPRWGIKVFLLFGPPPEGTLIAFSLFSVGSVFFFIRVNLQRVSFSGGSQTSALEIGDSPLGFYRPESLRVFPDAVARPYYSRNCPLFMRPPGSARSSPSSPSPPPGPPPHHPTNTPPFPRFPCSPHENLSPLLFLRRCQDFSEDVP